MVDFALDEDVRMVQGALRTFLAKEVDPAEKKLGRLLTDERQLLTEEGWVNPTVLEATRRIRRASATHGFYAMHMPREVGGSAFSKVGMMVAWREVMRRPLGLSMAVLGFVDGPTPLFLHCDEQQKKRYLEPLMRGEKMSAFCLTEPQAGSDVSHIETRAVRKGDAYVLRGTKTFVTGGPYADFYQVFAKVDGSSQKALDSITCFLVDRDSAGLSLGSAQLSLAADGAQCEVILDDVEVPVDNRVAREGEGFRLAIGNIADTRVNIGGMCVGLAEFLIDQMVRYANEREAFGRPIGKQGQIQYYIAESAAELYAMENMALHCAWKIDQGLDAIKETSMLKLYATESLFRIADRAIQVHGGNGLMRELPLEKIFRFARVLRIPEGTSEIQRWTIAKELGL
ncbi:MAG: acyl-CoA dehydrogenase family protein [Thermoplasmatota archaeon]